MGYAYDTASLWFGPYEVYQADDEWLLRKKDHPWSFLMSAWIGKDWGAPYTGSDGEYTGPPMTMFEWARKVAIDSAIWHVIKDTKKAISDVGGLKDGIRQAVAALRKSHHPGFRSQCENCGCDWPCDESTVADRLEALLADPVTRRTRAAPANREEKNGKQ